MVLLHSFPLQPPRTQFPSSHRGGFVKHDAIWGTWRKRPRHPPPPSVTPTMQYGGENVVIPSSRSTAEVLFDVGWAVTATPNVRWCVFVGVFMIVMWRVVFYGDYKTGDLERREPPHYYVPEKSERRKKDSQAEVSSDDEFQDPENPTEGYSYQ